MALRAFLPDLVFHQGEFRSGVALVVEGARVASVGPVPEGVETIRLRNRALLPGLVNAHSHAFQRAIRGRTEWRSPGHAADDFWTWREQMYSAASRLSPEGIFAISRMCFLEMALAGITSVGEFHYLHRDANGAAYSDPNELAHRVIAAAHEVGLRIALLRVAYQRSGFGAPANPLQKRFIEPDVSTYLNVSNQLAARYADERAWVGHAPHSIRAVEASWLNEISAEAKRHDRVLHMHVSEQPKENRDCVAEHGVTPVQLLAKCGVLGPRFTAVHAVHLDDTDQQLLRDSGSIICACPTTERNLGDGIVQAAVSTISLGTDSQVQIDLLEDARELEYHLRLQRLERAVLAPRDGSGARAGLAQRLFACATINGARSIHSGRGDFTAGESADFFTVDLDDPSIAAARPDDLLATIVFSLARSAIRDVVVRGKQIIEDGRHAQQSEIVAGFTSAMRTLWENA